MSSTLTIPKPMQIARARGHSVRGQQSRNRTIRFDEDEWALIQAAADKSGVDKSSFIRWVTLSASNEVMKDKP